jgi:uncharacterized cupredoxin-like copper-binding protein
VRRGVTEQKRSIRTTFTGLFAFLLLVALAGCGADKAFTPTVTSGPSESTQVVAPTATTAPAANDAAAVNVILTDYRISAFTTVFEVGKTYQFNVSNNGAVVHGFTIEAEGANNQPLTNGANSAVIQIINPGESQTLTWTFTTAGKLQIASHLNDDFTKGMVKTGLTVN